MSREKFGGGSEQFKIKVEDSEGWSGLDYLKRIIEIREGKLNETDPIIPITEAIIFENLNKIPKEQIEKLSHPLQKIVEEAVERLRKGE